MNQLKPFQMVILGFDWIVAICFAVTPIVINEWGTSDKADNYYIYNEYTAICSPNLNVDAHYYNFITVLTGT